MDEPSWWQRMVTYHFGSGDALWTGWVLILLGVWGSRQLWRTDRIFLVELLGLVWIALSAWPARFAPGLLIAACLARWLSVIWTTGPKWLPLATRHLLVVVIAILAAEEWRCRQPGSVSQPATVISVIGDSITAGLNDRERTWPQILAESSTADIVDVSQQGATVKSAQRQLDELRGRTGLLVLEIGGNDLLEREPVAEFTAEYTRLLHRAVEQFEQVVVVELPLPPLSGDYGFVQRRWARHPQVVWLPKRDFIGVLTTTGATVDGIHLSKAGQALFATMMARVTGQSQQVEQP